MSGDLYASGADIVVCEHKWQGSERSSIDGSLRVEGPAD